MSKDFSYDSILKFSIAWLSINWLILPDFAIEPSWSNFFCEFFLTHSSIKQFPGPESNASKFSSLFIILVIFEIPPIFIKQIGNSIWYFSFIFLDNKLWKIGVKERPGHYFLNLFV